MERLTHTRVHQLYQKACLRKSDDATRYPSSEVRGVREQRRVKREFKPEWFSHLRSNFWKGYFDTIQYMNR